MKHKILTALSAAALLWTSSAGAQQTRDAIEASMAAHAQSASKATSDGVAALQAGDTTKGCADLHTADSELGMAIDLLTQDADLIRADTSLNDADRASQLDQVLGVQKKLSDTREKLLAATRQHCG